MSEKHVSIEELKAEFLVRSVAPFGECIVIPGDRFDPDWEALLSDQGYKCFFIDLDRRPVTVVKLKKAAAEGSEKVVYEPMAEPVKSGRAAVMRDPGRFWTDEDDLLLMKLWNEKPKLTVAEIAKSFPKRSGSSVANEVRRLHKDGTIQSRWIKRKKGPARPAETKRPKKQKPEPMRNASEEVPSSISEPTEKAHEKVSRGDLSVPSISTVINVNVRVDCGNPASVDAFKKLLKELSP